MRKKNNKISIFPNTKENLHLESIPNLIEFMGNARSIH